MALPKYANDMAYFLLGFESGTIPHETEKDTFDPEYQNIKQDPANRKQSDEWKGMLLPRHAMYWSPATLKHPDVAEQKRSKKEREAIGKYKSQAECFREMKRKERSWVEKLREVFFRQYEETALGKRIPGVQ